MRIGVCGEQPWAMTSSGVLAEIVDRILILFFFNFKILLISAAAKSSCSPCSRLMFTTRGFASSSSLFHLFRIRNVCAIFRFKISPERSSVAEVNYQRRFMFSHFGLMFFNKCQNASCFRTRTIESI